MKIYLDSCCWNRPFDDQRQDKIRIEAGAIRNIMKLARWQGHTIFGSLALDKEIAGIKDGNPAKYAKVLSLYDRMITARARLKKPVFEHYEPLAIQAGITGQDVIHLCTAISAGADYLLTTDIDFVRFAAGLRLPLTVMNPMQFSLGGLR